jgi:hypothetical protein
MEKKMSAEVLARSLQMAVDEMFVLDEDIKYEIELEVKESGKNELEESLAQIRDTQLPGLRAKTAEALGSGCLGEIKKVEGLTTARAMDAYERKMARIALKDAKIGPGQTWNYEGYML